MKVLAKGKVLAKVLVKVMAMLSSLCPPHSQTMKWQQKQIRLLLLLHASAP